MTKEEVRAQARRLPQAEQLELVQDLWDDVGREAGLGLTPELAALLDRRQAAAEADPQRGEPWDVVHARIRARIAKRRA